MAKEMIIWDRWCSIHSMFKSRRYLSTTEIAKGLSKTPDYTRCLLKRFREMGLIKLGPTDERRPKPGKDGDLYWALGEKEKIENYLPPEPPKRAKKTVNVEEIYRRMAERRKFSARTAEGRGIQKQWFKLVQNHDKIFKCRPELKKAA